MTRSPREIIQVMFSGRMLVAFFMGTACGLPLLLTLTLLQAWMKDSGVDLGTIGLFALVGLPYTLKFLWAPLLDRYVLYKKLGRRRSWLILFQACLFISIIALGRTDPVHNLLGTAFAALLVAFFSASQDIVVDAYRREVLADDELGYGSSLYIAGYRIGMLLAGGGGLILADFMSYADVYIIMALTMFVALTVTFVSKEPDGHIGQPKTLREAVIEPFVDYFRRRDAMWILAFILLYKIGDTMASTMTTPFYLDIGFSKTEIGAVVKLFGYWAVVAGGLVGGVLILRIGIYKALWFFGFLQALSTAGFAFLAVMGNTVAGLAAVIAFENISGGMGTAAYVAFMASLTNKRFTATQYALLTSLMGVPRVITSAPTGYLAEGVGWVVFFLFCTLIAIPGLLILRRFKSWYGLSYNQESPG